MRKFFLQPNIKFRVLGGKSQEYNIHIKDRVDISKLSVFGHRIYTLGAENIIQ